MTRRIPFPEPITKEEALRRLQLTLTNKQLTDKGAERRAVDIILHLVESLGHKDVIRLYNKICMRAIR